MEPIQRTKDNTIDLQKDLRRVKDSLSQTAVHAKDKAGDLVNEARDKTTEVGSQIATYVKDNPLAAVGYSLLAGFLVALLIRKH